MAMARRESGMRSKGVGAEVVLVVAALLFLFPVVMIYLASVKPESEIIHFRSVLPERGTLANYRYILGTPEEVPAFRWLLNSLFVASCTTLLVLAVDSLAAYALSRLRPRGGKAIFAVVVGTLMVPGQVLLVPVYLILSKLGWIDTPLALIVPAGAGAFGCFCCISFLRGCRGSWRRRRRWMGVRGGGCIGTSCCRRLRRRWRH